MTLVKSNKKENTLPSLLSDFFDTDKFFGSRFFEKEINQSLPAVNIKEGSKQFDIEFAAPGFSRSDFKIDVDQNILTVSAEKNEEKNEENKRFTRKEFSFSTFSRSFTLPETVNADKIDAKYANGLLHLQIPKKEESRALPKKQITVN